MYNEKVVPLLSVVALFFIQLELNIKRFWDVLFYQTKVLDKII
jgi:hypothetical protein